LENEKEDDKTTQVMSEGFKFLSQETLQMIVVKLNSLLNDEKFNEQTF
jgi:hypothetical protein